LKLTQQWLTLAKAKTSVLDFEQPGFAWQSFAQAQTG
jgi:hypothetical protein